MNISMGRPNKLRNCNSCNLNQIAYVKGQNRTIVNLCFTPIIIYNSIIAKFDLTFEIMFCVMSCFTSTLPCATNLINSFLFILRVNILQNIQHWKIFNFSWKMFIKYFHHHFDVIKSRIIKIHIPRESL